MLGIYGRDAFSPPHSPQRPRNLPRSFTPPSPAQDSRTMASPRSITTTGPGRSVASFPSLPFTSQEKTRPMTPRPSVAPHLTPHLHLHLRALPACRLQDLYARSCALIPQKNPPKHRPPTAKRPVQAGGFESVDGSEQRKREGCGRTGA